MDGLIAAHQRMDTEGVTPVVHAAIVAYGSYSSIRSRMATGESIAS